jgi:hypothetical protein
MKLTAGRPFADPEKAARRLMQHAHAFEVVQDREYPASSAQGSRFQPTFPPSSSTADAPAAEDNVIKLHS